MKKQRTLLRFTLVELLVVCSIIMVIASLLLPSLAKARSIAYGASCSSKIRGLALIMNSYTNDYSDYLPFCESPTYAYGYASPSGPLLLGGYVKNSYIGASSKPSLLKVSPFKCPSTYGVTAVSPYYYDNLSYGYNLYVGYRGNAGSAPGSWRVNPGNKITSQKTPGKTSLLVELGAPPGASGSELYCEIYDNNQTTILSSRVNKFQQGMRHSGNGNVAFVDGHNERFREVPMMKRSDLFFNKLW